jgi:superfamily II DNA/RNA helicase
MCRAAAAAAVRLQGYVHRVGRTGRAGQSGIALTLFTPQDDEFREQLQQALQAQQQSAAAAAGGAATDGGSSSSSDDDSSGSDEEGGDGGRASKRRAAQDGQVSVGSKYVWGLEPLLRMTFVALCVFRCSVLACMEYRKRAQCAIWLHGYVRAQSKPPADVRITRQALN